MSPQWSPQYTCNWRLKKSPHIVKNPSDIVGESSSSWESSSPRFLLLVELVFQLLQLRDWLFYRPLFKLCILPHFVEDLALDDCEEGAGSDPPHTFHFDTVSLPCQLDILIFSSFHVLLAWFVLPKSGIDPSPRHGRHKCKNPSTSAIGW